MRRLIFIVQFREEEDVVTLRDNFQTISRIVTLKEGKATQFLIHATVNENEAEELFVFILNRRQRFIMYEEVGVWER